MLGVEGFLDLARQYESGGRNVPNYAYDATHTAQGYYQITNTNWQRYASSVPGATLYSSAMQAPEDVQRAVARAVLADQGPGAWTNYNNPLAQAVSDAGGFDPGASGGAAGGSVVPPNMMQGGSQGSVFSPSTWFSALGDWIGSKAGQIGLIAVGIILLLGAVYLFASRTQLVASNVR